MKHTHLRPEWWRPVERSGSGGNQNGAALNTNKASKATSNQSSQATTAVSSIFATQVIGPAAMASGTNIKDSWIADSCSNIHICNDIRKFVQYEEIKPIQIQTGGGLIKAIGVGSVELTVARTDHSAHTIIFTKVYHCPNFFTNIVSLSVLRGKGAFFDGLHNTINFVKDRAEIAYTPYINGLNLFILVDNPIEVMALATERPRLYEELPTEDTVPEVSRAPQEDEVSRASRETEEVSRSLQKEASRSLQEGCEASRALQEDEASRSLQEQDEASRASQKADEVSRASLSGGDSQSGGAAGDHDIAPQPIQPPLTDDELSRRPVVNNIRRFQETDKVSRASLSGDDSQSEGDSGDHDIAPQPDRPPLTDDELSSKPVIDITRRFQEADEVSRASLSGGDSQSGGASGDHDIAPQPN
jgi:hypothetical protein